MRPADVICGLCRVDYSQPEEGCEVCISAKRRIIWPATNRDMPTLGTVAARSVKLLDEQIRWAEREWRNQTEYKRRLELTAETQRSSRALATLLGEARKLEEKEERRAAQLSFDQQLDAMEEWFEQLPMDKRRQLVMRVDRLLSEPEDVTVE